MELLHESAFHIINTPIVIRQNTMMLHFFVFFCDTGMVLLLNALSPFYLYLIERAANVCHQIVLVATLYIIFSHCLVNRSALMKPLLL